MGFFLPADIHKRISAFLEGGITFPFVSNDEILGIFFMFGKKFGVKTDLDILSAKDIARRTIDQIKREIFLSKSLVESNIEVIRENYQRRVLQIYVEFHNYNDSNTTKPITITSTSTYDGNEINERIIRDPSILMSCYAQHVAYYKQKCFFEIFDPFKMNQLDEKLHHLLLDRMVMLSYNFEKSTKPSFNTLSPFIDWIHKQ